MINNRVEEFKAAIQNQGPEECNFIERMSRLREWSYFNLDEV